MEIGDTIIIKINDTELVGELSLQINATRDMIKQSDKKLDWNKYKPGKMGMTLVVSSLCDITSLDYGYDEAREAWELGTAVAYKAGKLQDPLAKVETGFAYIQSVNKTSPDNAVSTFTMNLTVTGESTFSLPNVIWDFETDLQGWVPNVGGGQTLTLVRNTSSPITGLGDAIINYSATTGPTTNNGMNKTDVSHITEISNSQTVRLNFDYKVNSGTCVLDNYVLDIAGSPGGIFGLLTSLNDPLTGSGNKTVDLVISPAQSNITAINLTIAFKGDNYYNVELDNITLEKV